MGKRRGGRTSKRSAEDTFDATDDIESPIEQPSDQYSPIENQILEAKHPFELNHFIESKTLTPSQRAITCCIQMNKGWASEDTLLAFLQTNWGFIGKINTKLPNNMPDTRILHINLAVKKKGIPLFVQNPADALVWTVNTSTESTVYTPPEVIYPDDNSDSRSSEPDNFEDCVLSVLKNFPQGITQKQLIEETEIYKNKKGLFNKLNHDRRVKAVLVTKRQENQVFENHGVWSAQEHISPVSFEIPRCKGSSLPPPLKKLRVSDLSVNQFYSLLKENKIFM